mmetsp:Transcript_28246/g.63951  ORF Transcript_28246/g.63951 Transcript_28246/m.63951 type:complete len:392 (+) Transcript_28246:1726-2901(+)
MDDDDDEEEEEEDDDDDEPRKHEEEEKRPEQVKMGFRSRDLDSDNQIQEVTVKKEGRDEAVSKSKRTADVDKLAVGIGRKGPARDVKELKGQEAADVETGMALMRGGEMPPGRMPGLIPFTTVPLEESLADRLYEEAIIHGWMSCIDRATKRRRERWCALHENQMYEFAERYNEFVLADKISLEGCVCFVAKDSPDSFVVRTAGLFSITSTRALANEIVYTADLPDTVENWVKAIALSSVIQVMRESKMVPNRIKELVSKEAQNKKAQQTLHAEVVRPQVQEPILMRFVSMRGGETTRQDELVPDEEAARSDQRDEEGQDMQETVTGGSAPEVHASLVEKERAEEKSKRRRQGQQRSKQAGSGQKPTIRDIARMGSKAAKVKRPQEHATRN